MNKLDSNSLNIQKMNIDKVKELFPNCVTEGKIDFDILKQMLNEEIDDSKEKYQFTWNGKAQAIKSAQLPSTSTLRPCKDKSLNWDKTNNLYIEGDNLEVLKQLQKTYFGKIKMIYIDPPYNTGSDFVYKDNFGNSIENYKIITSQESSSNPETTGRYHTNWLNMMYPRLSLARNLLKDDGAIFISIDDNEQNNLIKICNEIYGENNFVATFPWRKRTAKSDVPFGISQDYEWVVCYVKSNKFKASVEGKERKYYESPDFPGRPWRIHDMTKQTTASERPNSFFTMVNPKNGDEYPCDPNKTWRITKDTFQKYYEANEIVFPGDYDFLKISKPVARYFKDKDMEKDGENFGRVAVSTKLPDDIGMSQNGTKEIKELFGCIPFSFPKSVNFIKYFINTCTGDDDIILDFFSGSATTAHSTIQANVDDGGERKYILVQLPEKCDEISEAKKAGYNNICEIGEERIKRAINSIKKQWTKDNASNDLFAGQKALTIDDGFKVFKLDSTNIKPWDNTAIQDETNLLDYNEIFKKGRTKEDVLYEIMLKYGIFDQQTTTEIINGKEMFKVGSRYMIVCLEDEITTEDIKKISELKPRVVVFKESGFANDNDKINAVYNLEKAGVEDVRCI